MKNTLKWIIWVLLVLPASFLLGATASLAATAWNNFVFSKLF